MWSFVATLQKLLDAPLNGISLMASRSWFQKKVQTILNTTHIPKKVGMSFTDTLFLTKNSFRKCSWVHVVTSFIHNVFHKVVKLAPFLLLTPETFEDALFCTQWYYHTNESVYLWNDSNRCFWSIFTTFPVFSCSFPNLFETCCCIKVKICIYLHKSIKLME